MSATPSPSPIPHAVTPLAPPLPTAPAVAASARRLEADGWSCYSLALCARRLQPHASSSKPSTAALDASSRNPHGAVLQDAWPRIVHLYLSPLPEPPPWRLPWPRITYMLSVLYVSRVGACVGSGVGGWWQSGGRVGGCIGRARVLAEHMPRVVYRNSLEA